MDRNPLQRYNGLKLDVDVTVEEIMRYARAVYVRVLYPDTPTTRDYRQDRVNIHIDYEKIIQKRDVLQRYIGLKLNVDVTAEEIMKFARGNSIRIIYPNTPVTLDLRPNRVNIHLDFDNTIQKVDKF